MSAEEAKSIARLPGVVSVFLDRFWQLHTTRSWDFLQHTDVVINSNAKSDSSSTSQASDTIIGIFDTGKLFVLSKYIEIVQITRALSSVYYTETRYLA